MYNVYFSGKVEEMAVVRKNITFTEQMNVWVQSLITQGDFANESEYIRDLIRHDREKRSYSVRVQSAIQEGLNSGVSDLNITDVWKEAEQRRQEKNG